MINTIKARARQAKQFAREHTTLVACAATAAVTYKVTRGTVLKQALEDYSEILYEKGREMGALEQFAETLAMQNGVLLEFVNEQGLADDVREFVKELA